MLKLCHYKRIQLVSCVDECVAVSCAGSGAFENVGTCIRDSATVGGTY